MANPIAVPGTVVPSGSLATPGGAQGVQGLQGAQGPAGGTGGSTYTASQSVLLTGTNFTLLNDVATPSGGQYYGYNGSVRGWFTPAGTGYTASQSVLLTGANFTLTGDTATPATGQYYGYRNGTRGWFRPDFINVLDYGADPNGSADSTAAIQNAANAMGGSLYFPKGTYLISSAITLSNGGRVFGDEKFSSEIKTNSATANIFHVTNCALVIEHLYFGASVTRSGGFYIDLSTTLTGSTSLRIRECFFQDYFNAINITGPTAGSVFTQDTQITNCLFISGLNGTGINLGGGPSTNLVIRECTWYVEGTATTQTGIAIAVLGDAIISDCRMDSIGIGIQAQAYGSGASAITQLTISKCVIDSCQGGIVLQGFSSGVLSTVVISDTWCVTSRATLPCLVIQANGSSTVRGIQVNNCQFMQLATGSQDGIALFAATTGSLSNIIISNCRIEYNGGSGISVNGSGGNVINYLLISNNCICSNLGYGVNMGGAVNNWQIVGNEIFLNVFGIVCGGSNTYFIISSNRLAGNTSGNTSGVPTTGVFVNANNI